MQKCFSQHSLMPNNTFTLIQVGLNILYAVRGGSIPQFPQPNICWNNTGDLKVSTKEAFSVLRNACINSKLQVYFLRQLVFAAKMPSCC